MAMNNTRLNIANCVFDVSLVHGHTVSISPDPARPFPWPLNRPLPNDDGNEWLDLPHAFTLRPLETASQTTGPSHTTTGTHMRNLQLPDRLSILMYSAELASNLYDFATCPPLHPGDPLLQHPHRPSSWAHGRARGPLRERGLEMLRNLTDWYTFFLATRTTESVNSEPSVQDQVLRQILTYLDLIAPVRSWSSLAWYQCYELILVLDSIRGAA